ncbi:hypothetical protein F4804DRAFT_312299 [Jackrogersella minutella]|nr:hypothetical protein F4804DRAFT_312299 [Jackrogersella minutella]
MSYYESHNPPPLPPRSPRPAGNVDPSLTGYLNWSYPPPPPGPPPPPQGSGNAPGLQPPPLPPRPLGYETITTQYNPNLQPPPNFTIPPPPPGPPPGIVTGSPCSPLSPYSQSSVSGPGQGYGYTNTSPSPLTPRVSSPYTLTTFPPPPPPPPPGHPSPNTSSSNPHIQHPSSASPYHPTSQSLTSGHNWRAPAYSSTSPNPTIQAPLGETPHSPPPVYSPFKETPNIRLPEKSSSPSIPSPPSYAQASSPQSSSHLSSFPPSSNTSHTAEGLEASFQSLTVKPHLPASSQPPNLHQTTQALQSHVDHLPHVPAAPSPTPRVSQPSHQIYELPTGGKHEGRRTEISAQNLPAIAPPAVTSCIDSPLTFATEWYWHSDAPEFLVCSRCYVDHIYRTRFRDSFRSQRVGDGKPRVCRFSKPRMRDHLFKEAIATGSLESALRWMRSRPLIPDCKGIEGVKGDVGIQWYKAKSDEIPGFLSCQACHEDQILTNQFSANFEPTPPQPEGDTWACDVVVPFIEKEYENRGVMNDWAGFVSEAKARISISACPGRGKTLAYGKKWFIPRSGPDGLVLCAGCYCDQVIHTGEEAKWEVAESFTKAHDKHVQCGMGIFSIRIAMSRAHETKNFELFWTAVHKLAKEKFCEDDGIEGGVWYSLPSDPSNFGICAGCFVAIAEPLNVSQFFVRKREVQPADTKWRCCFSVVHPRFRQFMQQLLGMYYTLDSRSFDEFASVYASVTVCPRDEDAENRSWYGWMDCTICPECYHDFARHSPLAAKMDLKNTQLKTRAMCEMYSPRMRNLFKECSDESPPRPGPLLAYSVQRRLVWAETVPQMRMMLLQAKMALNQQKFLNVTSSFYNHAGMLDEITYGSSHTYGAAGVGYGFANMNLLQGAMYGKQAMAAGASAVNGGTIMLVGQLERRWRAVE